MQRHATRNGCGDVHLLFSLVVVVVKLLYVRCAINGTVAACQTPPYAADSFVVLLLVGLNQVEKALKKGDAAALKEA